MGGQVNTVTPAVEAKTAAYTVVMPTDSGKIFTNRGAGGSVTFTLPAPSTDNAGTNCYYFGIADQNAVWQTAAGNEIVTHNDPAATSLTYSTSGDLIGTALWFVSDGTSWLAFHLNDSTSAVTETVA